MNLTEELEWRGLINQSTFEDIDVLNGDPIKFYWGVDPSADSMTIGNLASAMLVKHFIAHGHEAILLVGGATGLIGDPDGKKDERNLKARDEIEHNKAAILKQYSRIFSGEKFNTVDNFDWFKDINFIDFLTTIGKHVPMNQMLARGFVQSRLETTGISFAEFTYSLIQAFDFLHLFREHGVTLQLCGGDQWGNSTAGVSLIRRIEGSEANVFTTPLVVNKATGVKFGKSENGAIWLDAAKTTVFEFNQFWLNVSDDSVIDFLKIFTMLDRAVIEDLEVEVSERPWKRAAQKVLAHEVTLLVHGAERTREVEEAQHALFGGLKLTELSPEALEMLVGEVGSVHLNQRLTAALVASHLASSVSDARRLMANGGVSVDGEKVFEDIEITGLSLVKKGKNQFVIVR